MRNKALLLAGALLVCFSLQAQQELSLYYLQNIQQGRHTNPALFPEKTVNFNLPVLPSIVFNFANSGFTYRDFIHGRPQDDSTMIDLDLAVSKLGPSNFIYAHTNVDILDLGIRIRKVFASLNVTEKVHFNFRYPFAFMNFFINGNAENIGETIDIGIAMKAFHYREYGLGIAYKHKNLQVGTKLKYLQGLANVSTGKNNVTLHTDESSYAITMNTDYLINTSGIDSFPENASEYFLNFSNPGYAVDLGASYELNNKFTFSASVIDLGRIEWRSYLRNFYSNGSLTYEGIDINRYFFSQDTLSFDALFDTLREEFGFEKSSVNYRTSLIPKVYVGGTMQLDSVSHVGVMLYGEFFDGLQPGITLAYGRKLGKAFSFVGTYSFKNRSPLNVGLGWVLTFGPVQLYAVGDNLSAYVIPKRTKSFNLRAGMNFAFGQPKLRPTEAPPLE